MICEVPLAGDASLVTFCVLIFLGIVTFTRYKKWNTFFRSFHLLSSAAYSKSKSSLLFGFILRSNSFLILPSFSLLFLISSCLSHSNRRSRSILSSATTLRACQRRKYDWRTITWKKYKEAKLSLSNRGINVRFKLNKCTTKRKFIYFSTQRGPFFTKLTGLRLTIHQVESIMFRNPTFIISFCFF